jgi:hypothetical protein
MRRRGEPLYPSAIRMTGHSGATVLISSGRMCSDPIASLGRTTADVTPSPSRPAGYFLRVPAGVGLARAVEQSADPVLPLSLAEARLPSAINGDAGRLGARRGADRSHCTQCSLSACAEGEPLLPNTKSIDHR